MANALTIGDRTFPSQKAAIEHCRAILYDGKPDTEITGEAAVFVEDLLAARADKLVDLQGMSVLRYKRDWQPKEPKQRDWTMCFWAELEDGTLVDFSYIKSVSCIARQQAGSRPGNSAA